MNIYLLTILLAQPILPELPVPPELSPSLERPVVVPLEHDTLGVRLTLGAPLGFKLFTRQDDPRFSHRTSLWFVQRTDHFCGRQHAASMALVASLNQVQIVSGIEAVRFENTVPLEDSGAQWPRSYANTSLEGLWHRQTLLAGIEAQAYSSTMSATRRTGGQTTARFFADMPWARALSSTQARLDPEGLVVLSDAFFQYQAGFMLITPSLQARLHPHEDNLLGAGASLNLIAVLGTLSVEFEGSYRRQNPVLLDSALLGPVQAGIVPQTRSRTLTDQLRIGAGYEGVECFVFTEQGEGVFWQSDLQGLPAIGSSDFSHTGAQVETKLERGRLSMAGTLRFLFAEPQTPWTPLWELRDSMSVRFSPFAAFVLIQAADERRSEEAYQSAYALLGCGVFYEREPFRVLLRADDLLDRRPQLWPGLAEEGRRLSLSVSLFATEC